MNIEDIKIPPEVVGAFKAALREMTLRPDWAEKVLIKTLAAWPGADRSEVEPSDGGEWLESIILPLPQEARDD